MIKPFLRYVGALLAAGALAFGVVNQAWGVSSAENRQHAPSRLGPVTHPKCGSCW